MKRSRRRARRGTRSRRCSCSAASPANTTRSPRWPRAATSSSTSCSATTRASRWSPSRCRPRARLFLMYTSGTTGRPKGAQHSIGGYLSYVAGTSKYYQDIHPEDTYWCFADIGWITGHSYIVYGPLALGTTSVMYEGMPDLPRCRAAVADRREARREHLPHRADHDPDAAQGRPRRAGQVRLPLQDDDHGRRADRAGRLALVLQGRRQGARRRSPTPGGRPRPAASSAPRCRRCSR